MSAHYFGGEVKETKRYRLGQLLAPLTRHFLLMTATPHNGKEEDFQLFMALLDADRFEGKLPRRRRTRPTPPTSCAGWSRRSCSSSTARRCSPSAGPTPCPTSSRTRRPRSTSEVTEYVREEMNRAERSARTAKARGAPSASP